MCCVRSCHHRHHARMRLRLLYINRNNAGMGIKTTHKTDRKHSRTTNIAHILPPASDEHRVFTAPYLLLGCRWLLRTTTCCCCLAHVVLPLLNSRYVDDLSLLASCSHPLLSISEEYAQNHLHVNSARREHRVHVGMVWLTRT